MDAQLLPKVWTVHQLETLKPGERLCFYRGKRADAQYRDEETRTYTAVLSSVFACADRLAAAGRIRLSQVERKITTPGGAVHLTDFIAEGV